VKFIWEENDISGGVRYVRDGDGEAWIISYISLPEGYRDRWMSTSLVDGRTTNATTPDDMARRLNEGCYIPQKFAGGLQ
jgi:hypothetical protein